MRSIIVVAASVAAIFAVTPAADAADIGNVVAIGDSMAAGTLLGPQVSGSILACGQSTGSYPELAMARVNHGTWKNNTCNGGHVGLLDNSWTGLPQSPPYQYNDGTTIPPQKTGLDSNTKVVILGSGGNEAYYGEVTQACLGHSADYNANTCTTTYGADGAGLIAKTNNSKSLIATAMDKIHTYAPNAKIFVIGVPRITPPDGAGCQPNPILTLADAPVWAVWEDSLRAAMMADVSARSSYAYYVDMQSISASHTMCAPNNMRWMNPWTVDTSLTYPGLALHNTPWGADATADALVSAFKAAGLSTGTPDPPTATRTSPTATTTNSTSQTFTYSGAAGSTFKCRLDNAAYATCPSSPVTITGVAAGSHTYSVTQTDASGKTSPAALVNWTVDTTAPAAPTVTRTSPNTSPTASASQTLTYSGAETGGTYQCKLDSGAYATCGSSPVTVGGLGTATHNYSVRQVDDAGNVGAATTVTWTVDVTPPGAPTVTRTSPTATPTNSTTQVLTYSGAESGGTYQCKLDSAAFAACSGSPVTLTGLAPGVHTYSVTQTDAVGNVGSASTITWEVDTTAPAAPTVTRTSPTASPTNSPAQTLAYSGAEAGGSFKCKLDSAAYAACASSPVSVSGLGSGSHTYSVTQTDAAGNTSTAGTVAWTVDVTPPPVPIVSGPSGTTALTAASISYSDSESGVTFQCKLDGEAYAACPASPVSLSGLSTGAHTYYVTATDSTGNVSSAGTASWTVDPTGFTVSITSSPSNPSTSSSASFAFETLTPGSTYECKLDTGSFSPCTSSKSYSGLSDGSHTFAVHAINGSQATPDVSRTWVIDATPPNAPTLNRTSPSVTPTNQTSQTFSLTAAEAGGVLSCKLDSAAYATCPTSPISVAGLAGGTHTYSAFQTDAAGNPGAVSTVTWNVDVTAPSAPTVTRTNPTATQSNSTSQTISYGGIEGGATTQCKLDTAAYGACPSSPLTLSGLSQGSHTYSVIQTDAAGNVSAEGSVTWSVDSIAPGAPTVLRTSPTAALANSSSQEISITPAESGGTLQCKLDSAAYGTCPSSPLTLTGLSQGAHTYSVTQTDTTGNVSSVSSVAWSVDTIAPGAPVALGFNRGSFTQEDSAEIGISPAESGGTFQCSLDSAAFTACTSPIELTGLAEGNHNFMVRQVDDAGNIGGIKQVAWTVDRVAPDVPTVIRTSPTSSPTYDTTATIAFASAEINGTLQCKFDNFSYATCPSSPVTLTNLSYATHSYSVRQVDAAGNVSPVGTVTWDVVPDTTPPGMPTVTRTSPTVSPTTATSQTITYSGAEAGGTYQCKLDGNAYTACQASPVTITNLSNGSHTVYVTQTDSSGNVSAPATVTWTVDNIGPAAPTVTRTSPSASPTPLPTQTISYSGAEGGGTFQCKLDSAAFSACASSPVSLSGLTDGTHTFTVTQTDAAGNVGSAATVTWVIDSAAPTTPELTRSSPTTSPTNSTSQTFSYSGEPGGTFQCKLDSGAYQACAASPATITGLSAGPHTYSVVQIDSVGNTSNAATVTWTVDLTAPAAPTLTRTSPSGSPTNATSQTVTYGGLEPGASAQCKLDGAAYGSCPASPMTLSGLGSGTHTFAVTQTDIAGNVSAPASVSWVVDLAPPPTPIVSGPSGTSGLTTASVTYSDSESGVSFQCKLDSAAYGSCPASPVSLTGLSNGAHTYYVTATDAAGNTSTAGTASWTVDPSVFAVSITAAPGSPTTSTSATFEFDSTIPATAGTTFECRLDAGSFAPCTSPKTYANLSDNSHTFTVRGVNGVQTTPEASRTWVVDHTPPAAPTLLRTIPSANPTNSSQQTLTITGAEAGGVLNCKVNESAYLTCPSSPITLSGLNDGPYTFSVTQTDAAGNVSAPATVSWLIDSVDPAAPSVTRTSPTADPTSSTKQTFSIGGEPTGTFECKLDDADYAACPAGDNTFTGLALGQHSLLVRQFDAAGNSSPVRAVSWTVVAPTPVVDPPTIDPPAVPTAAITSAPKAITPARTGGPFSLKPAKTVGSFKVKLSAASTVSIRLERVAGRKTTGSTAWTKFKLKAGETKIYLTGRATTKRALAAGTYKVHLIVAGGDAAFSRTFKVKKR